MSSNYGFTATGVVVLLIDLLNPVGWRLAEARLVDTLIGCAIALLIGFAPWPMSWCAHLPRQFALAVLDVCRYMEVTLGVRPEAAPERDRSRGALADAACDLPRAVRRARRVPAHHVRAALD